MYSDCLVMNNAHNCPGSVCWGINFLKPSRIEFFHEPASLLAKSDTQASAPQLLEYIYRTAHPVLRWLPTKLAEWLCGMGVSAVQGCDDSDVCKMLSSSSAATCSQRKGDGA
jgi:hypothetical protein